MKQESRGKKKNSVSCQNYFTYFPKNMHYLINTW